MRLRQFLAPVSTDGHQELTLNDSLVEVELEQSGRCPPFDCTWFDYRRSKHEMIIPALMSRVKKRYKGPCLRVKRTDIAPLPCVASQARIRKVFGK